MVLNHAFNHLMCINHMCPETFETVDDVSLRSIVSFFASHFSSLMVENIKMKTNMAAELPRRFGDLFNLFSK